MFEVAMKYLNDIGNKTLIHLVRQRPTPASYVAEVEGNQMTKSDEELLELAYDSMYADLFAQKKQSEQLQRIEEVNAKLEKTIETMKKNQESTDLALFELSSQVDELLGGGER